MILGRKQEISDNFILSAPSKIILAGPPMSVRNSAYSDMATLLYANINGFISGLRTRTRTRTRKIKNSDLKLELELEKSLSSSSSFNE